MNETARKKIKYGIWQTFKWKRYIQFLQVSLNFFFSILKYLSNGIYILTVHRNMEWNRFKQSSRERRINLKPKKYLMFFWLLKRCQIAKLSIKKRQRIQIRKKNQNTKRRSCCLWLAFHKEKKNTQFQYVNTRQFKQRG